MAKIPDMPEFELPPERKKQAVEILKRIVQEVIKQEVEEDGRKSI